MKRPLPQSTESPYEAPPRYTKRGRQGPGDYFMPLATDFLGQDHQESVDLRIERLSDMAKQLGFTSIFDAILKAS